MAARGSSLVEAVLACSGRLEKEGLAGRLARLSRRAEELKEEVCSMINQRYVEFLPSVQSAKDLESQVQELSAGIDQLRSRIENEVQQDVNVAIADFADLKQQLERELLVLSVLKHLQEFDTALKQFATWLPLKKYTSAANYLNKARRSLKTMKSRRGFELKILKALGQELTIQTQNILYLLDQEWQQMVVWKLPQSQELSCLEAATQTELHLCLPREDVATDPGVSTVLQAFAILGELEVKFRHFGQLLLKHILKPLICCPSLRLLVEDQPDGVTLKFESVGSSLGHSPPLEVFAKLKSVFKVLHRHLLDTPLAPGEEEEEETGAWPGLAEVLSSVIWRKLADCLICDCLVHSIPSNSSQLAQYTEVIKATEEFEKALKDMKFLPESSVDLLTYARNVNCHFANKKCQDVIVAARNLMTSEIHNTVKVTPDSVVMLPTLPASGAGDQLKLPEGPEALLEQVTNLENKTKLSPHTFSFPTCRISDSVQRLVALAYQTLQEASASTDQCCSQLFYLVRNVFHLFCDVVPMYHKENLQKLPQLAAIHHNNCMYIAHHLLTMGHQFRSRLSDGTATFVDLVPGFRKLGSAPTEETGQNLAGCSTGERLLPGNGDPAEHGSCGNHEQDRRSGGHLCRECRPVARPVQDRGGRGAPGLRAPAGGKGEPALPGGGAGLRAQVDDVPGAHVGLAGQSARNRGPVGRQQRSPCRRVLPQRGEEPHPSLVPEHRAEGSCLGQHQVAGGLWETLLG
ncbi:centromere/kinetochore protein zw10 homolog isoform 2-T2 [Vipera latastei]